MDEPLPVLKDFEPDLDPPPPDPWWKRCLTYILLCVFVPAGCAAFVFGAEILVYSRRGMQQYFSPTQFGIFLRDTMAIAVVVGFVGIVAYCVKYEIGIRSGKDSD